MSLNAKYRIGVMGSASGEIPKIAFEKAKIIGEAIASKDCILVTGATTGVPSTAALAAKKSGGITLGISPAKTKEEHVKIYKRNLNPYDIVIWTGLGFAGRNHLNIFNSDALIFIAGGIGTFNEFSLAYDEAKIIGVLLESGGFCDKIKDIIKTFTHKKEAFLIYDKDPMKLVSRVYQAIEKAKS